ncbi:MAG: VanZ family protein [Acidobacteria bacterium]|nr:MAG: VanZ family protein [Acidobacteriota bacterium]
MKYWMPAVFVALFIFFMSGSSNPPGADLAPDYVAHFLVYGFFALTLLWGVTRGLKKEITFSRAAVSFFISSAYSATDEFHQSFVPHRLPSWSDILADTVGAACFLLVVLVFAWVRRRRRPACEASIEP